MSAIRVIGLLPLVLAIACGDDAHRRAPDLRPVSSAMVCPGCGPHVLTICVGNEGDADAGGFDVWVDTFPFATIGRLASGGQECVEARYDAFGEGPMAVITVDPDDRVDERNENNNTRAFPRPASTACDVLCPPSPTPASTPITARRHRDSGR